MDNYRKPTVNRYWKRPKPKVYDCNMRDAERFYQDSYRRYVQEKEDRNARARSIDTDQTFYDHLRAGPIRRETSKPPPLPPSLTTSSSVTDEGDSKKSAHEMVSAYDPAREAANLEERLARIKNLREELGLPSEAQGGGASSRVTTSLTRESRAGDYESSYKSESKSSRANGLSSRGEDSSYSYKSERASRARPGDEDSTYSFKSERTSSLSRPSGGADESSYSFKSERSSALSRPSGGADESSYSFKSERSSRANAASNGLSSEDYSFKSERKADSYKSKMNKESPLAERKDYSFKSEKSSSLSSSRKAKASAAVSDDLDLDDDDVMKMMKKMPSSKEILDRISKMDLDD